MTLSRPQSDFIEELRDAFFALDHKWKFIYVNKAAEQLLDRSKEELIGSSIWVEFPDAVGTTFFYQYHRAISEKIIVQFQEYYPPLHKWFNVTASPYLDGIAVHFRDITASRKELELSREHYRSLFERHPDSVYSLDLTGKYLSVNRSFEKMLGYSAREALDLSFHSLIASYDLERTQLHFAAACKGIPQSYEIDATTKEGRVVTVHVTNVPMIVDEQIVGVFGIARDITDRKQAELDLLRSETELKQALHALKETEELYRLISENSQDAISLSAPDGTLQYVSPGVTHLMGFGPEELIGKKRSDFYHSNSQDHLQFPLESDVVVSMNQIIHKDGRYIWIETSSKLIRNEQGDVVNVLGIGRDISQRKAAEELLLKSEKLTLTGQLAAGIAHEIRNPLTAIKGFLQLLENGYAIKQEHVQVMNAELRRIESILNELLFLAKPSPDEYRTCDLNDVLDQVITLMNTEATMKDVILHCARSAVPLTMDCDVNQLKQVFINFIKNSIEAMPEGGEVRIQAAAEHDQAVIRFIDHGCGIPEPVLERLGQPFFTTKDTGTGLGLTVSFAIIESHQGHVTVDSKMGEGTTIEVRLPIESPKITV